MRAPSRQRGVALLTALLVVAIAMVLLALMFDSGEAELARTRNVTRGEQADAYAQGLEAWAEEALARDSAQDPNVDSREDLWAAPLPPTEVPGGRLQGQLQDRGGCFNLNNLAEGAGATDLWGRRLRRLLTALKLEPELADAIGDWIDADFEPHPRGAEDTHYLLATPSYRAANRRFAHVSELRLVRGISEQAYERLAPHVCALPFTTEINVNTATVPVLMSLEDNLGESVAQRLAQNGHARHANVAAFAEQALRFGVAISDLAGLATKSEFFVAHADVELDGIPFAYTSLIQRRAGALAVIARMRGREDW